MINRKVRQHIENKIEAEYRKRLNAETKTRLNDPTVKKAIARFEAEHKVYVQAKQAAKEAYNALTKLGVTSEHGGCEYHTAGGKFGVDRYGNNTEALAWRELKMAELGDLELAVALSKDKLGVVEAFVKGLSNG